MAFRISFTDNLPAPPAQGEPAFDQALRTSDPSKRPTPPDKLKKLSPSKDFETFYSWLDFDGNKKVTHDEIASGMEELLNFYRAPADQQHGLADASVSTKDFENIRKSLDFPFASYRTGYYLQAEKPWIFKPRVKTSEELQGGPLGLADYIACLEADIQRIYNQTVEERVRAGENKQDVASRLGPSNFKDGIQANLLKLFYDKRIMEGLKSPESKSGPGLFNLTAVYDYGVPGTHQPDR